MFENMWSTMFELSICSREAIFGGVTQTELLLTFTVFEVEIHETLEWDKCKLVRRSSL